MTEIENVIRTFMDTATSFSQIKHFSEKPGIYAVHYMGSAFPVYKMTPAYNDIIYIGKTQSGQSSRDANTHFASGKSGSSTLRRTLGALMQEGAKLKPVPRSQNPDDEKRFTNYKFDDLGEERITTWMQKNLGLSYYEFIGNVADLDDLETILIQKVVPILNIDHKNPANPYLAYIKSKRLACVELAKLNQGYRQSLKTDSSDKKTSFTPNKAVNGLYFDIWKACLPKVKQSLAKSDNLYLQMEKWWFDSVGNRNKYSFRLDLDNRIVQNNIGGSAVARDLNKALNSDAEIIKLLHQRKLVFRLDSRFYFSMEIL